MEFRLKNIITIKRMTEFPTLYHKAKGGELRQWRCWAEGDTVNTEYGCVSGALQTSSKKVTGKNSGKKNATTPEEQAISEAQSMHTFKIERKYSTTKESAQLPSLLPMLAHKYDLKKHNGMLFLAQPKLDGVRCVARWEDNKVVLYSRSGKVYDVKHISDELEKFMGKEDIFDGELYIHGLPLQTQISLVKRPQEASTKIKYWVYDMPVVNGDENLPFSARQEALSRIFDDYHNKTYLADMNFEQIMAWDPIGEDSVYVVETPTYWCDDVDFYLKSFLKDGYEGMMLRLPNSEYLWGYRSNDLLKVKEFQDSEFEIVDVVEGEGKMLGHGIFVCKNDLSEATFKAIPKMTMEERAEIFKNKETYIGKLVTVKYFDRTEDQIPRFPVALAVRDYD